MHSAVFGWGISYRYLLSPVGLLCHLKHVSLLIFCPDALSFDVTGVVESPTIIVFLSISPFMSVNICFMYLGVPVLGAEELMLLNRGVGEDSWKSLGQQGDQTSQS